MSVNISGSWAWFFNAQLSLAIRNGLVMLKYTSVIGWYVHHRPKMTQYENVVFMWFWTWRDFRKKNNRNCCFELKITLIKSVLDSYQLLMKPKSWIFCEKENSTIDDFVVRVARTLVFLNVSSNQNDSWFISANQ
jgi:hypothetical protein